MAQFWPKQSGYSTIKTNTWNLLKFESTKIFKIPLPSTYVCVPGGKKSFSENLAYVLNGWAIPKIS